MLALRLTLLALLCCPPLLAHDLWIEPSRFACPVGGRLAVRLRVGQQFQGDPFPRDPQYLARFSAVGSGGEVPIPGVAGTDPAGFLLPSSPGLFLLVYASHHAAAELDAAKFEKYLADEGLEKISAWRAGHGKSGAPGKEIYSRCAKALITVGDAQPAAGSQSGYERALGLTLELVPERNPTALPPGRALPVRLLYRGAPLAGAKVVAMLKSPPERPPLQVAGRTDRAGRVELRLAVGGPGRSAGTFPGVWLIKAVHMVPAPAGSGADWESFWASFTFELPGSAGRPAEPAPKPHVR
ncbi:MAG TPA: DUF4198 domain-containing protein [Thermoanaerobaculia bacterium]|nr:DUF4198 domain-containing protein [Thermoanaerobaculia bacterium]